MNEFIAINHIWDGMPSTLVTHALVDSEISITSPLTGSHYIKTWDISQQEATGLDLANATANGANLTANSLSNAPVVANNYLTKDLPDYQGVQGYNYNRRYEAQNGNINSRYDNGFHGINPTQVSGYRPRNRRTAFPSIDSRGASHPDPIDFSLSIEGKITIGGYRKAKKVMLWLKDSDGKNLIFTQASSSDREVLEYEFTDRSPEWKINIPPLRNPYFGVVTIEVLLVYREGVAAANGSQPPGSLIPATKYSKKVNREIVFLGLQLGICDAGLLQNQQERTHVSEKMVTDFSDQSPITGIARGRAARNVARNTAKGRFRTRRMQKFSIENRARPIFWKRYDGSWAIENRTSPAMPQLQLETQILGLTDHAIGLLYAYQLDESRVKGPLTTIQKENLRKHFTVTTNWKANINYTGGHIRPATNNSNYSVYAASNNFAGYSTCLLVNQAVRPGQGPDTLPSGYRVGYMQKQPIVPPQTELTPPSAGMYKRHWQQYNDPVRTNSGVKFGFDATTIGWIPASGEWRDQNGARIVNPQPASAVNPNHHFMQKIWCGDMIVSAKVTLFHKTYELYLPTTRIDGTNPTLGQVREVLTVDRLNQAIAQVPNIDVITDGAPNRFRRVYVSEFIRQFGAQDWLDVCANILWHESGSNAPAQRVNGRMQLRQQNNHQEVYQFHKKYTEFKFYGSNCFFHGHNQPVFGAPAGWSIAQLDNGPPTETQIWHWDHAVAEALRRIMVDKMVPVIRGRSRLDLNAAFAVARPRVVRRGRVSSPGYTRVIGNHLAPIKRQVRVRVRGIPRNRVWYSNLQRRGDYAGNALFSADVNERADGVLVIAWLTMRAYNGGNNDISWDYMYSVGKDVGLESQSPYYIGLPMPNPNNP